MACVAQLRLRTAEPLAPPSDWTRAVELGCRCARCTGLGRFLASPDQKVWTFEAAEAARSHMEATVKRSHCDVDLATDRHGRPYSLVCTKNRASYERRARQRKTDLEDLARLA